MIHTTNLTLQKFQENFDFIESKMKDSTMYRDALQAFTEYMPSHAFTDDQKAMAYSDFMSKTFYQSNFWACFKQQSKRL